MIVAGGVEGGDVVEQVAGPAVAGLVGDEPSDMKAGNGAFGDDGVFCEKGVERDGGDVLHRAADADAIAADEGNAQHIARPGESAVGERRLRSGRDRRARDIGTERINRSRDHGAKGNDQIRRDAGRLGGRSGCRAGEAEVGSVARINQRVSDEFHLLCGGDANRKLPVAVMSELPIARILRIPCVAVSAARSGVHASEVDAIEWHRVDSR